MGELTNSLLKDNPSLINTEPFAKGWMIKIKLSEPDQVNALLEAEAYKEMVN